MLLFLLELRVRDTRGNNRIRTTGDGLIVDHLVINHDGSVFITETIDGFNLNMLLVAIDIIEQLSFTRQLLSIVCIKVKIIQQIIQDVIGTPCLFLRLVVLKKECNKLPIFLPNKFGKLIFNSVRYVDILFRHLSQKQESDTGYVKVSAG